MFEKVRDIIVDTLSCEMEDVTMEADLAEDLGADSLDAVELNIALEEQLGLSIADEDRPNMKTVGDIVRYLEAKDASVRLQSSVPYSALPAPALYIAFLPYNFSLLFSIYLCS